MKVAFLFSGQGAQAPGMGKDLYNNYSESKAIFNKASEILAWDIKKLCFEDPKGQINQTRYTQPALFVASMAAFEAAKASGLEPDIVAGFSVGEYGALCASGALSFEQTLLLIEKRAIYMDEISQRVEGKMAAIIGLTLNEVEDLCQNQEEGIVEIANDNCPGQLVISGESKAVEKLCKKAKEKGARRTVILNVSGPFHSSLLNDAAEKMRKEIQHIKILQALIPIISNVTARPMDAQEIQTNIPLQIKSRVRFRESIEYLIEQDVGCFIEIGIGRTLNGFVKKQDRSKTVCHIEDQKSLHKTIQVLEELKNVKR